MILYYIKPHGSAGCCSVEVYCELANLKVAQSLCELRSCLSKVPPHGCCGAPLEEGRALLPSTAMLGLSVYLSVVSAGLCHSSAGQMKTMKSRSSPPLSSPPTPLCEHGDGGRGAKARLDHTSLPLCRLTAICCLGRRDESDAKRLLLSLRPPAPAALPDRRETKGQSAPSAARHAHDTSLYHSLPLCRTLTLTHTRARTHTHTHARTYAR